MELRLSACASRGKVFKGCSRKISLHELWATTGPVFELNLDVELVFLAAKDLGLAKLDTPRFG